MLNSNISFVRNVTISDPNSDLVTLVTYIFYSFLFVVGISGNSLVIYVILSTLFSNPNREVSQSIAQSLPQPAPNGSPSLVRRNGSLKSRSANSSFRHKNSAPDTPNLTDSMSKQVEFCSDIPQKKYSLVNQYTNNNYNSQILIPSSPLPSFSYDPINVSKLIRFRSFVRRLRKEKLSVTNFYLINLAFSDFFYTMSIPILMCTIYFKRWIFGFYFCKTYLTCFYLFQCSSAFILIVLSVDRFLSVKYPLSVSTFRHPSLARFIIVFMWLCSLLFITPVLLYTSLSNGPTCTIDWPHSWNISFLSPNQSSFFDNYLSPLHAFCIYTFLLNYFIPVGIITLLYSQILRRLHRKNMSNIKKSKAKGRITRMVLAIIVCYVICWTPYWTTQIFIYIHHLIGSESAIDNLLLITHFSQIIAYFSSALNPFIYSYMSEAFKANLESAVTTCCICCCASPEALPEIGTLELRQRPNKICRSRSASIKKLNNSGNNQQSEAKKQLPRLSESLQEPQLKMVNFKQSKPNLNKIDAVKENSAQKQLSFKCKEREESSDEEVSFSRQRFAKKYSLFKKNDSIKTFVYKKPKSRFAFAINFHPFSAKNSIIRQKISLINSQVLRSKMSKSGAKKWRLEESEPGECLKEKNLPTE